MAQSSNPNDLDLGKLTLEEKKEETPVVDVPKFYPPIIIPNNFISWKTAAALTHTQFKNLLLIFQSRGDQAVKTMEHACFTKQVDIKDFLDMPKTPMHSSSYAKEHFLLVVRQLIVRDPQNNTIAVFWYDVYETDRVRDLQRFESCRLWSSYKFLNVMDMTNPLRWIFRELFNEMHDVFQRQKAGDTEIIHRLGSSNESKYKSSIRYFDQKTVHEFLDFHDEKDNAAGSDAIPVEVKNREQTLFEMRSLMMEFDIMEMNKQTYYDDFQQRALDFVTRRINDLEEDDTEEGNRIREFYHYMIEVESDIDALNMLVFLSWVEEDKMKRFESIYVNFLHELDDDKSDMAEFELKGRMGPPVPFEELAAKHNWEEILKESGYEHKIGQWK